MRLLEQILENRFLNEALIILGKRPYPNFGHVVIMAGGAGSGKGFVQKNLLGIEGKRFDVDELKTFVLKSDKVNKKLRDEHGVDLKDRLSDDFLKDPANVGKLHAIVADTLKLDDKAKVAVLSSVLSAPKDRKPNIIVDTTMRNVQKLSEWVEPLVSAGYRRDHIHIVWVVNDIDVAVKQNQKRSRVVPDSILKSTHVGAAGTVRDLVDMGKKLSSVADGDFYLVFNKSKVDSEVVKSKISQKGKFVKSANYFRLKMMGKSLNIKDVASSVWSKVQDYVPNQSFNKNS